MRKLMLYIYTLVYHSTAMLLVELPAVVLLTMAGLLAMVLLALAELPAVLLLHFLPFRGTLFFLIEKGEIPLDGSASYHAFT
jgi:hypothetical protein